MKIKGRCRACGRDLPLDVLLNSDPAGHCPFCGSALDTHYSGSFVNALRDLERAGTMMSAALDQLGNFGPGFELDRESVMEPIRTALETNNTK